MAEMLARRDAALVKVHELEATIEVIEVEPFNFDYFVLGKQFASPGTAPRGVPQDSTS